MIRASTLLLAGLVAGAGLFTYQVKHRVSLLDRELAQGGREMVAEQERLHVLEAEWSLLNEPERLRRLAEQHLSLSPMQPRQFAELPDAVRRLPAATLPAAPPPEPAPAPAAPVVAAAPGAAPAPPPPAAPAHATPPAPAPVASPPPAPAPQRQAARPPAPSPAPAAPAPAVRTVAAGITQEALPPPPGHRTVAPRSAPAAPAPPPAVSPAVLPPRPVVSPASPQMGSSLGGSAPALAPPTPWRPTQ